MDIKATEIKTGSDFKCLMEDNEEDIESNGTNASSKKQTDTERNEAIKMLSALSKDSHKIAQQTNILIDWSWRTKSIIDCCILAISALKSQSEAEKKIEEVREYCKTSIYTTGVLKNAYSGIVSADKYDAVIFEHNKILEILGN